ncbi:hypothetical protein CBR_g34252 [Chara braunii]|uniref:RanBD1 domain-containing protein n=1 Tax=Chara braunii TaxID=69332 RepID=A0A388JYI9_CHABU|nr:hypothetical protein CBR_g34252 [Chara braunii]|eukprot:GBG62880.1 hypothetical protein CBR_g34252 [Chara braunii]
MAGGESGKVEDHASTTSAAAAEEEERTPEEEEDTGANFAPLVKLEEVAVSTGEEAENTLFEIKAKLYRFDKSRSEWKERGVGQVKLLEHKETKKIRLLMRQQRTLKICANHGVSPSITLQEHAGSDKSWVWHAIDFADGEQKDELFAMRFGSVESAEKFKNAFEEARSTMCELLGVKAENQEQEDENEEEDKEEEEVEGGFTVVKGMEKLKVEDGKDAKDAEEAAKQQETV